MHKFIAVGLVFGIASVWSQPTLAAEQVPESERTALSEQAKALREQVATLRAGGADETLLADIEVCAKAADWIARHNEFFKPGYLEKARHVLEMGRARAAALAEGKTHWTTATGGVGLGYRSEIDDSAQPYVVTFPAGFDHTDTTRRPLHVVLHGRDGNLTEASFLADAEKRKPIEGDYIRLDVYGRGNNAFRWAGETDVFEALESVRRRFPIDERRVVLWGFSMGGAGAWHLGLHHPDRWVAAGAGAGFVDYYGYLGKTEKLPAWQDATLSIYDATNYALNAANVPFVTYGGDQDKQLLASTTMVDLAEPLDVKIEFIIGKDVGHKFTPEGEQAFQAFLAKHAKPGRPLPTDRKNIRFTTHTLKYDRCGWLRVLEMDTPYQQALVDGEVLEDGRVLRVMTENVRALAIHRDVADSIELDGATFPLRDAAEGLLPDVYFAKSKDNWEALDYNASRSFSANGERQKRHNLQGPIDDAFMSSFVVVPGTGTPWNAQHQAYADWSLARFESEYDKFLRAKLPTLPADDITDEILSKKNLVLFGDPGSNPLIAKVLGDLPIEWTKEGIRVGEKQFDPATHAVVLIFPNPLNPSRYVVLNSGHTFHADAFEGTNALLYPRHGDLAILKFTPDEKQGFVEATESAQILGSDWNP